VDRDRARLNEAEHDVKSSAATAVLISVCDVKEAEQVKATITNSLEHFGKIDAIVNNAGVMIFKPLVEHTIDDWTSVLSVDLLGAILEEGIEAPGRVVICSGPMMESMNSQTLKPRRKRMPIPSSASPMERVRIAAIITTKQLGKLRAYAIVRIFEKGYSVAEAADALGVTH
jgi:hypothetical protein